jgi:hypothetical protein
MPCNQLIMDPVVKLSDPNCDGLNDLVASF